MYVVLNEKVGVVLKSSIDKIGQDRCYVPDFEGLAEVHIGQSK